MNLTRSRFSYLVRVTAAMAILAIIIGYASYRSLPYLSGPSIKILQPLNGSSISSTTVTIIGRVDRVNSISLNQDPIQFDESGNFRQTVVVFPGTNVFTLNASDQFNRSISMELRLFGTKELPEGRMGSTTRK